MARMRTGGLGRVMPRSRQRRPDGRPLGDLCLRPGERPAERRPIVTVDHQPVMVEEVLHFLAPHPDGVYLDGTLGAGRHTEAILNASGGRATVVGIDRDPQALERARWTLRPWGPQLRLVRGNFSDATWVLQTLGIDRVDGVLLDLGMSSMQVDDPARGFSFRQAGPLDMRMDPDAPLTAAEVVNTYSQGDLTRVLRSYGEEPHAGRIARAIVDARKRRPLRTTTDLAAVIDDAMPPAARKRGHPARRTFQALRMEVNAELDVLEQTLRALPEILNVGGRAVVLSYHSLEDKLVKRVFQELSGPRAELPGAPPPMGPPAVLRPLHRGAILPSDAEVSRNPRASSARLRACERVAEPEATT